MHYTYQCDQLTLPYLSVPLLVYFNKLQNSLEIATYKLTVPVKPATHTLLAATG